MTTSIVFQAVPRLLKRRETPKRFPTYQEAIEEAGGLYACQPLREGWEQPWAGAGFLIDVLHCFVFEISTCTVDRYS
ncbi:uncharacterized protein L203_105541 [Cryptococcus depauperatus CBS 7841]|uniref:Uncharacterized protein n=1 Tax=Cryptococcus depauperatus CBS 7841 TaxID=1295531 RepID=A0AAJ8JXL7_9TREE